MLGSKTTNENLSALLVLVGRTACESTKRNTTKSCGELEAQSERQLSIKSGSRVRHEAFQDSVRELD